MTLAPVCAFAVDGQVLINQPILNAAGGPYSITQTGSYKLSGNLLAKDNFAPLIVVGADNVTIDLNGFTISGTNVCRPGGPPNFIFACSFTSTQNGIEGGSQNLPVTNGTVAGMGQYGIYTTGVGSRIDSVTVNNNGSDGIRIGSGLIDKCRALYNGEYGIYAIGEGGSVQKSFIANNRSAGLSLNSQWRTPRIVCRTTTAYSRCK